MVIYTKYTYYIINTIVNIENRINNIAHYTFIQQTINSNILEIQIAINLNYTTFYYSKGLIKQITSMKHL